MGLRVLRAHRPDDGRGRPRRSYGPSTPSTSARSAGPACPTTSACGACGWPSARASTSGPTSVPCTSCPGVRSPLRKADDDRTELGRVRENSEGEYVGFGGRNLASRGRGGEVAVQSGLFTDNGCDRIMRFAFDLARTRRRRKSPASPSATPSSTAWSCGTTSSSVSPGITRTWTESVLVDAMSAEVRPPSRGPIRRRRLQPPRRYPLRPRQRPGRQPRPGRQRQPQP